MPSAWFQGPRCRRASTARGLVLVPSNYEAEELFRHRSSVSRSLSLEEMGQAIADAVSADTNPTSNRADA
jgi:hypothetical protein